ncbi:MAG: hypothetical protein OEU36_13850 [Gammaproteobacteria bacterium]|nr:hypothetical protein [Gammaproteobacteria bacterium]
MTRALRTSDLGAIDVGTLMVAPLTLPFHLRRFFSERITMDRARRELAHALDTREQRFLELLATQVYPCEHSAYRRLLVAADCKLQDVRALIQRHGLEGTLVQLARMGVYLSPDEFKGKTDVVRSGVSFRVTPESVAPLKRSAGLLSPSSGTSNNPLRSLKQLDWMREETWPTAIFLAAHELENHAHAGIEPIIPGVAGVAFLIIAARLGIPCERWFAWQVPIENSLERLYDNTIAYELALAGSLFGPGFDRPRSAGDELEEVVHWITKRRKEGKETCVRTVASNAARVARTAIRLGASLEGATFIASGEPITHAKVSTIKQAGARTVTLYGFEPGVQVAFGCAAPRHIDEMHVNTNTLALVEHPEPVPAATGYVHPLLYTTLYPSASMLLINFQTGDYATMERGDCGCPMGAAGLDLRIHNIGSFEKLTAEGLAYSFAELAELLEGDFPAEFGGGPGDFQLVEHEIDGGRTVLTLLVDPRVGEIEEGHVLSHLAESLARGSRGNRFMTGVWQEAESLRLERRKPYASARGKVLPIRYLSG